MMFSIRFQRISHSKSDHYGIEIEMISRLTKGIEATELKSDHFGIEIILLFICGRELHKVKIRPFWD